MKECFVLAVKEFDFSVLNENVWSPDGDKKAILYLREMMQEYLEFIRRTGMPNVVSNELFFELKLDELSFNKGIY